MIYKGRCWKFGDDIGIDSHIMPLKYTLERISDPEILKNHVMEEVDPEFHKKVKPGDIIIAGKRFGHGNPHLQGFLGLKGLGLAVLAESIPRGTIRIAVFSGVPMLPFCEDITKNADDGDYLEVDFLNGSVKNISKNSSLNYEPLDKKILEIIENGGMKQYLQTQIKGESSDS
ncbi:MAG: 3-isopropylmalate dehydratase [Tindallia sp. MSAO_Bac2]|nr:MAG: 3-isopropylmalate dehydratase [Tindallia sp. MSAO_Bac2]